MAGHTTAKYERPAVGAVGMKLSCSCPPMPEPHDTEVNMPVTLCTGALATVAITLPDEHSFTSVAVSEYVPGIRFANAPATEPGPAGPFEPTGVPAEFLMVVVSMAVDVTWKFTVPVVDSEPLAQLGAATDGTVSEIEFVGEKGFIIVSMAGQPLASVSVKV